MASAAHQQAILQVVASIPEGRVCSYGQVARMAGLPGYARQVGQILKNLPPASRIPWHRIINSRGRISFPPKSASFEEQKTRLEDEGITVKDGAISLACYCWPHRSENHSNI